MVKKEKFHKSGLCLSMAMVQMWSKWLCITLSTATSEYIKPLFSQPALLTMIILSPWNRDSMPSVRHYVRISAAVKPVPFMSQTTSPGSSQATLLSPVTVSLCGSTVRATPPFPSSPPSTGAAGRGCAVQPLHREPTTTAAQLLLLCRCILYTQIYRPFSLSLG